MTDDGADYAEVLRARANSLVAGTKFPTASDVQLVFNVLAYIVDNLPTPYAKPATASGADVHEARIAPGAMPYARETFEASGRQEPRDRLAQYNPRRMCTCGHPLGSHTAQDTPYCLVGFAHDDPRDRCPCIEFTEPVPDVTPCLRSSNCTLTHNHRGDCELRYP